MGPQSYTYFECYGNSGPSLFLRQARLSGVLGLGTAFQADYARHAENELTTDRIITKMRDGDRLAQLVWRRYIDRLARGWHSR